MTGSAATESPRWRKSSYSQEGNCVEICTLPDGRIGIRNGDLAEALTIFTRSEIHAFFKGVRAGEFDDLI